jgi:sulfate transport system ATP-binding protein
MSIEVRGVTKRFGSFAALKDITLTIPTGELVALLGPSGSGKTTLLRVVAGLEFPDAGGVFLNGEDATRRRTSDRRVGFVFQHYALFRHMSVFENIAFGLRVRPRAARPPEHEIRRRVNGLLHLVQLDPLAHARPSQLSGGQRQRVALARALAVEPDVLLLDEPFGALDARVRKELRRWLRRLHDELHVTSVFVTHDQEEALEVADRVVVMNEGEVQQIGTPEEVYHHPASPFVYHFLGNVNLFHGRVEDGKAYIGPMAMDLPKHIASGKTASLYVRPHEMDIHLEPAGPGAIAARVEHVNAAGPVVKVELVSDVGGRLEVELSRERYQALRLGRGVEVFVTLRATDVFIDEQRVAALAGDTVIRAQSGRA